MPRLIYDYTKSILESVSFDPILFRKELKKGLRNLLPYEVDHLNNWLVYYTTNKPELQHCLTDYIEQNKKGVC